MASRLILASQSPRRKELLQQVGLTFDIQIADIDESTLPNESSDDYVKRVAICKAETVARQHPGTVIVAADTIVSIDGQTLTKPKDFDDACWMWSLLSGRQHQVKTTVVIQSDSKRLVETVSTAVYFKTLTVDDMQRYWASGEPHDKAGGYAIQGRAAAWVRRIEGSYSNVVGLPLYETIQLLAQFEQMR